VAKYTRTTIEGGVSTVALLSAGENVANHMLDLAEELIVNNKGNEDILFLVQAIKENVETLLTRCELPKRRVAQVAE
jgi:hypothetical protein